MSKTDKVLTASSDYLKKRNIDALSDKIGEISSETDVSCEEKIGLQNIITPSSPNSFSFSATTSQLPFIDQQYMRLKSWMTETSEPCRTELSQVLFPLFVHLFIELLSGAGKNVAKQFLTKHCPVFKVNREYEYILRQVLGEAVSSPISREAVNSPVIQSLRSGKYCVRLSELTLNYFLRYLQTSGNPTLLQIFNNYIEVEVSDMSGATVPVFKGADFDGTLKMDKNEREKDNSHLDCTTEEIEHIKDIISNVRNCKPLMPTLCVYNVFNSNTGLSCAGVDNDFKLLACGFEDSVIKLWRLNPPLQNIGLWSNPPQTQISNKEEKVLFCNVLKKENDNDKNGFNKEEEDKCLGSRHINGGEFCKLRGHTGPIFDVSFSHNSSHLFSVGEDSLMRLWDLTEGQCVAIYQGHNYPILCVSTSHQTSYIATGSYDRSARLWTSDCTYSLRTFSGHSSAVECVEFHPNCSYLATGSKDQTIRLWQVTDASVARIFVQHNSPVNYVTFSPNGKYLASGSESGEVFIWDIAESKVLCSLGSSNDDHFVYRSNSHHSDSIASICWTKDSSMVISASTDGTIRANYLKIASKVELIEVDSIVCGGSFAGGITLVNTLLNKHNFLSAIVAVHGER